MLVFSAPLEEKSDLRQMVEDPQIVGQVEDDGKTGNYSPASHSLSSSNTSMADMNNATPAMARPA
jgi:hypothetical protein